MPAINTDSQWLDFTHEGTESGWEAYGEYLEAEFDKEEYEAGLDQWYQESGEFE